MNWQKGKVVSGQKDDWARWQWGKMGRGETVKGEMGRKVGRNGYGRNGIWRTGKTPADGNAICTITNSSLLIKSFFLKRWFNPSVKGSDSCRVAHFAKVDCRHLNSQRNEKKSVKIENI